MGFSLLLSERASWGSGMLAAVRFVVTTLVWCACWLTASPAYAADDAHTLVRKGVDLQREANWSGSITALERARSSNTLSNSERAECAFHLAAAYLAIGSEAAARRELALVLDVEPTFEPPPYTSPKVASLLGEVARSRASAAQLDARPPRRLAATSDAPARLELGFEARRAKAPVYGVVRYRMRGDGDFVEAPLVGKAATSSVTLTAEIPAVRGGVLEYYADALSSTGAMAAGTAARPLELPLPELPAAERKRVSRPPSKLLWLAIPAGVVIGAGLGLGLYFGLKR